MREEKGREEWGREEKSGEGKRREEKSGKEKEEKRSISVRLEGTPERSEWQQQRLTTTASLKPPAMFK